MAERVEHKQVTRAIIEDDEGRILLGKRARGIGVDQWALVGGKPDEGEDKAVAVVREVKEELGLDFVPVFYLERVDAETDPDRPWIVTFYTGTATGYMVIKDDEISAVGYFTREEIEVMNIAFDHKARLLEYMDNK